jgi:hypothetical protein
MPRIVVTHSVKDVKLWVSKKDERAKDVAPFATEVVEYVAADGSNKIAVSANIHDMDGMMAFMQTPESVASMEAHGVLQPLVFHVESSVES